MPNTPSAKLVNGAVVRVGDVVPMTDGRELVVASISSHGNICVWTTPNPHEMLVAPIDSCAIDLAALAALQARAPGEREAMRALAEKWRSQSSDMDRQAPLVVSRDTSLKLKAAALAKRQCADALAAALEALARKEG